jgi:4-hydroxy-3-methylbut-2-enyl diphosphate reductase
MRVKRAAKYGFCSGVRVADIKVKRFARGGGRGAILGQVVHNERVVEEMGRLGVRTVKTMDEVADGVIVFSAHGVPPSFHEGARRRGLEILDTTCKFVYDIHHASQHARAAGAHLVFIALYHIVHTVEQAQAVDWSKYAAITIFYQTTLNAEEYEDVVRAIEDANPRAARADTICYATKENQDAARALASDPEVDLVLVVGGKHSANTRHLHDICARFKPSYLVQGVEDLDPAWLEGVACVGLTAGASTPDYVIDEVEQRLLELAAARA